MSATLESWVVWISILPLSVLTPAVAGGIWRQARPNSRVPFLKYAPHYALLLVVWASVSRAPRTVGDLVEAYLVTATIWAIAIVLISRLTTHPPARTAIHQ